jgi:hypothetical protein
MNKPLLIMMGILALVAASSASLLFSRDSAQTALDNTQKANDLIWPRLASATEIQAQQEDDERQAELRGPRRATSPKR